MQDRIRFGPLKDKITDPETAAQFIQNGTNVFISGFTAGYPKLIPRELVRRAESGETFKINLFAGASTGSAVDGILSEAGLVAWRRPYMSDRIMRRQINADAIKFKDDHLSCLAGQVRAGNWGEAHVAVVEAVAVTHKGHLVPTMSVGNTPTYVREAEKIIIEISTESVDLEGIHDIYIPEDPPYRMPIPIYRTGDRIGKPFIEMDPSGSWQFCSARNRTVVRFSRNRIRVPAKWRPIFLISCGMKSRRTVCRRRCPGSPAWGMWPMPS